ncbi:Pre-mRNA-processing-splicing factor 8A [Pelomyxa schiedti]|nr:Pre-mRNA-processing-splicing factor 8A [Pelomyxa schiedti]
MDLTNDNYYEKLFEGESTTWLVEETSLVWALHRTFEGNLCIKPTTGSTLVLNAKTGQACLKLFVPTTFVSAERMISLAKWKAAEEVATLIRALPSEERPTSIFTAHKCIVDPLSVHMLDFPDISIAYSRAYFPFRAIMKITKIHEDVVRSYDPRLNVYNVYDDWLKTTSPHSAFLRLLLLLRSILVDYDQVKAILCSTNAETLPNHIWPSMSQSAWIEVEARLKEIVINRWQANNPQQLSPTESQLGSIILGTLHPHPEIQTNVDWRARAIEATELSSNANNISLSQSEVSGTVTYVIPENLIKKFICIADVHSQVGGILYGYSPTSSVREVRCIVIPPQCGCSSTVSFARLQSHSLLREMGLLGWIHTQTNHSTHVSPHTLVSYAKLAEENGFNNLNIITNMLTITCSIVSGGCLLLAHSPTLPGVEWGLTQAKSCSATCGLPCEEFSPSFYTEKKLVVESSFMGFYLVPDQIPWNFNFMPDKFNLALDYTLTNQNPKDFYHETHRPMHFSQSNGDEPSSTNTTCTTTSASTTFSTTSGNEEASAEDLSEDLFS